MDRFDAMNVFVRVVEAGSLSAGARAISMSLASVSRQLTALETQFGMQFLQRTTRHIDKLDQNVQRTLTYVQSHTVFKQERQTWETLIAAKSNDIVVTGGGTLRRPFMAGPCTCRLGFMLHHALHGSTGISDV